VDLDGDVAQVVQVLGDAKLGLIGRVLTMRDRIESITWPWIIPIDCAAVDNTWELTASVTELITDRRESQHDVKILSANLHKECVNLVPTVALSNLSCLGGKLIANCNLLIRWE